MKKTLWGLMFTAMAISLSSCNADVAISSPEETTAVITETVDMSSEVISEGFVFYDYTGEAVDGENVSEYTLNYAMGWQAFGGENLHRIDNTTVVNSMAVTDVYSEYSVFPTRDGYGVNYSEGGYTLVSADDPFSGVKVKGILKNSGSNWILKIIREESDEYFFDISVGGTLKLEEAEVNSTMTVGGQTFYVQPMDIIIRNADEFDEFGSLDVNSVYMTDLILGAISFNAYAQDAADSPATLLSAATFLKKVEFLEELPQDEPTTSNSNLINYTGESVVDENDFKIFEEYFYGNWIDESDSAPDNVELYYSGDSFSLGLHSLIDIYADENNAYLVTMLSGETTIYAVDFDTPDTMYEYSETNHGGRPKDEPDFIYTKTPAAEEDYLGFFGILKLNYVDNIPIEVLTGNTLQLADGSKWVNYGEKISVIEKDPDKITIRALCRREGDNPFEMGLSDEPLESRGIIYAVSLTENEWVISIKEE